MSKQTPAQFINSIYSLADENRYDEKPDDLRACLEMICEMIIHRSNSKKANGAISLAKSMTDKQRKDRASKAARARWDKERPIKFVVVDD